MLSILVFLLINFVAMSLSVFLYEKIKNVSTGTSEITLKNLVWVFPLPIIGLVLFHVLQIDFLSLFMVAVYVLTMTLFVRALFPLNKGAIIEALCFVVALSLVALTYIFKSFFYNDFLTLVLSSTVATILAMSMGFKTSMVLLGLLSVYDFVAVYSGFMPSVIPKTLELALAPIFVVPVEGGLSILGAGDVVFSCFILIEFWKNKGKRPALVAFLTLMTAIGLTLLGVMYGLNVAPVIPSIFLASLIAWALEKTWLTKKMDKDKKM